MTQIPTSNDSDQILNSIPEYQSPTIENPEANLETNVETMEEIPLPNVETNAETMEEIPLPTVRKLGARKLRKIETVRRHDPLQKYKELFDNALFVKKVANETIDVLRIVRSLKRSKTKAISPPVGKIESLVSTSIKPVPTPMALVGPSDRMWFGLALLFGISFNLKAFLNFVCWLFNRKYRFTF